MRNPKKDFYERVIIKGKKLGEAVLENAIRERLGLPPFFGIEDKIQFEAKLIPSETDKRIYRRYKKLVEYLEEREKMLTIHKLELDRQIAWRVVFLNAFLRDIKRLLSEPIVITLRQDKIETKLVDETEKKVMVYLKADEIGKAENLKLTPLQEKQKELNGIAIIVKSGKNNDVMDKEHKIYDFSYLELLRTNKSFMPDPDFKNIQYRVDMIKGITQAFSIIGAEVGLDIPKAYEDKEIKTVLRNARAYNELYGEVLANLTTLGIKPMLKCLKDNMKLINLESETTDKKIKKVQEEVKDLKAFDFDIGNKLENILYK